MCSNSDNRSKFPLKKNRKGKKSGLVLFIFNFRTRECELGERRDSCKPGTSGHGGKSRGRAGFSLSAAPKTSWLHTWRGGLGTLVGFSLPSTAIFGFQPNIFGFGPCPCLQGGFPGSLQRRNSMFSSDGTKTSPGSEGMKSQWQQCRNSLKPSSKPTLKIWETQTVLSSPFSLWHSLFFSIPRNLRQLKPNVDILGRLQSCWGAGAAKSQSAALQPALPFPLGEKTAAEFRIPWIFVFFWFSPVGAGVQGWMLNLLQSHRF